MRTLLLALLATPLAGSAFAQASVVTDLWRVAEGAQVVPASLSTDGTAAFWTPAVALGSGERYRIGVDAIHSPSEIGVSGGLMGFSAAIPRLGTVSFTYGRLGIGSVGFTETSPEVIGGATIDIYNEAASVGIAGHPVHDVVAGVAMRFLSGRMGFESKDQIGLDIGAQYVPSSRLRFGFATHFMDPQFGADADPTTYNLAGEVRSKQFTAWGTNTTVVARVGLTSSREDETAQLFIAGVTLGSNLSFDYGTAHEQTRVDDVWRSRLGLGVMVKQFAAHITRDGGANDFGATYRFSMTATFK